MLIAANTQINAFRDKDRNRKIEEEIGNEQNYIVSKKEDIRIGKCSKIKSNKPMLHERHAPATDIEGRRPYNSVSI